jgi:hypothetical protein
VVAERCDRSGGKRTIVEVTWSVSGTGVGR